MTYICSVLETGILMENGLLSALYSTIQPVASLRLAGGAQCSVIVCKNVKQEINCVCV